MNKDNLCNNLPPKEIYNVLSLAESKGIDLPKSVEIWWEKETEINERENSLSFKVTCDETNNSKNDIKQHRLNVDIEIFNHPVLKIK